MKALLYTALVLCVLLITAGCSPIGDWGMGGGGAPYHPGVPRGGFEKKSGRMSGPGYLPNCYIDGRTLVMVYEREKEYLEVPLDDIRFNLKPRRYNTFSYRDFKELDDFEYESLSQVPSVPESVQFIEEKDEFVANRYSKGKIDRKTHTIYRFSGGHWDADTSYKWLSFMLTDPQGSDRVIYIRRESY